MPESIEHALAHLYLAQNNSVKGTSSLLTLVAWLDVKLDIRNVLLGTKYIIIVLRLVYVLLLEYWLP